MQKGHSDREPKKKKHPRPEFRTIITHGMAFVHLERRPIIIQPGLFILIIIRIRKRSANTNSERRPAPPSQRSRPRHGHTQPKRPCNKKGNDKERQPGLLDSYFFCFFFRLFAVVVVWKWNASAALNTSSKSVLGQRERTERPRPFIRHPGWSPDAGHRCRTEHTYRHAKGAEKRERWNESSEPRWRSNDPVVFIRWCWRLKRKQEGIIGPRGYLRNILLCSFFLFFFGVFVFLVFVTHFFFHLLVRRRRRSRSFDWAEMWLRVHGLTLVNADRIGMPVCCLFSDLWQHGHRKRRILWPDL